MSLYQRFEDLPVWQEAARLYNSVLDLLQSRTIPLPPGLRLQLERAALSVSNNIAEGVERLTASELRNYLVIARGSAGEVRSMMAVVSKRAELWPFHARLADIRALAESCGRQLGAWLRTVRQTDQRACRFRPRNGPAAKARLKRQLDRANLSDSMPPG